MITLQILIINSILLDCKLHKIAVKKIIVKTFLSNAKTKLNVMLSQEAVLYVGS